MATDDWIKSSAQTCGIVEEGGRKLLRKERVSVIPLSSDIGVYYLVWRILRTDH